MIDYLYSFPNIFHCDAYRLNLMKFSYLLSLASLLTLNAHVLGLAIIDILDLQILVDNQHAPQNTTQSPSETPDEPEMEIETEEPKPPVLTPESLPL